MKIFKKIKQDMKEVRDAFHGFNMFQKLWMVLLVFITVNTLMKFLDKSWKRLIEFLERIKMKKETDYSDDCPDKCEDLFGNEEDDF